MAQYDGSIRINTAIDQKGFERGSKSLMRGMERLGNSLNGIIKIFGIGLSIAGLVSLGKQAVDTASDLQEVQNVVDVSFGDMSHKMEELARTSVTQFGISRLSAKQMGSTFMAMGKSMVGSMEEASDMAIALTKRSADMASFFNKTATETATALKSIYTGETESLKEYGVVMTEVNLQEFAAMQGITKKISAMTQAEKVQLRYNYIMQQTALAAGDFARTSNSWANQTRILSEQFKELLGILGTGLITALTPAVKFLNTILSQLIVIAQQIGSILSKLLGITVPVSSVASGVSGISSGIGDIADDMDTAASSAGGLADSVEEAGKAAKGALAPFDKLTVLNQDLGAGGGGAGAGGAGGVGGGGISIPTLETSGLDESANALDQIENKLQPIIDKLKELKGIFIEGFEFGFGDWEPKVESIKESFDGIGSALSSIFTDPEVTSSADNFVNSVAHTLGTLTGSTANIGLTIGTNILGGIEKYLSENIERIKGYLISMFQIETEVNIIFSELFASIAYIFESFASDDGQQLTANLIGIFSNAFMGITELAANFGLDILNIITQPFIDNKEQFRAALEGFLGVLSEVAGTLKESIGNTFDKINEVYDEKIKPFFDSVASGLSDLTGKFLEFHNTNQPLFDDMAKQFDNIWKTDIQPIIDKTIELIGKISDLLKALWENVVVAFIDWVIENVLPEILPIIENLRQGFEEFVGYLSDTIDGLLDILGGIIDFLTGVFSLDWEKAWNGIKEIVVGIFKAIGGFINATASALVTIITTALLKIMAIWKTKWNAVKSFVSMIWSNIKDDVTAAFDAVKNKISNILNLIQSTWNSKWNGLKTKVSSIWQTIKNTVSSRIDGVKNAISGGLDKIKSNWDDIWEGLKNTVKNIMDSIRNIVDEVIGGIKNVIDGISNTFSKLKNTITGIGTPKTQSSTYSVSPSFARNIPQLASGAVIRGGNPFMAVLGEQPKWQTNVEAPLSTIKKAVREELRGFRGNGDGTYTFIAQLNGKNIFEETYRQDQIFRDKTGHSRFAY